jgi:glycosyltransferase involved in cell wall biosynthesis
MRSLISICLPTYNRPDLLRETLESCLAQTYTDFEIVIGDDSNTEVSAQLVAQYIERHPGKIHYRRNVPSLGQNANVNDLFARANGERLLLLHDDDLLLPQALERLASCWDELPTLDAAFGKQQLITQGGTLLPRSAETNVQYYRRTENAGRQAVPAIAGVLRMFPNNGYLVRTSLARAIGYRHAADVGQACDTDFGLRLCLAAREIWFLDEYVEKYRISEHSVTSTSFLQHDAYDVIAHAPIPPAAAQAQRIALADLAPGAASSFARLNQPRRALAVYLSPHYGLPNRLRLRGIFHAALIALSFVRTGLRMRRRA